MYKVNFGCSLDRLSFYKECNVTLILLIGMTKMAKPQTFTNTDITLEVDLR